MRLGGGGKIFLLFLVLYCVYKREVAVGGLATELRIS
jgi:hypothetical protein